MRSTTNSVLTAGSIEVGSVAPAEVLAPANGLAAHGGSTGGSSTRTITVYGSGPRAPL